MGQAEVMPLWSVWDGAPGQTIFGGYLGHPHSTRTGGDRSVRSVHLEVSRHANFSTDLLNVDS